MFHYKLTRIARDVEAMAGRYHATFGKIKATFPTRSGGANLIIGSGDESYYVLALKPNKEITPVDIRRATNEANNHVPAIMQILNSMAREFGITKYSKPKIGAKEFMSIVVIQESLPPETFFGWFPELKESQEESKKIVGGFTIVQGHEVDDKDEKKVEELIHTASRLVDEFGLGKVLYGRVYIVPKLKGRTVADYHGGVDEIRISDKAIASHDNVRSFVHELGHRLIAKKMVDKKAIWKAFSELVESYNLRPSIGDQYLDYKGRQFQVVGLGSSSLYGREMHPRIVYLGDPKMTKYKVKDEFFLGLKKIQGKPVEHNPWIPTVYSMKNEDEWFCEIFSFALTDNRVDYKEFVKSVLT